MPLDVLLVIVFSFISANGHPFIYIPYDELLAITFFPIFGKEHGGNTSKITKVGNSDMTRDFAYCFYTTRKICLEQLLPFVKLQGKNGE